VQIDLDNNKSAEEFLVKSLLNVLDNYQQEWDVFGISSELIEFPNEYQFMTTPTVIQLGRYLETNILLIHAMSLGYTHVRHEILSQILRISEEN
jgi:hypothetical protein